jgi:apolipoprotein N-acyltransferase
VAAATRPDLIVWPETSVPGYLGVEEELTQRLIGLAQDAQRPLLVGSPIPVISPEVLSLQNSAILMDDAGNLVGRYDKLHLVPFGEFIPFERAFPWLRTVLPPIGDFVPGKEYTVFRAPPVPPFSVLICFEDIFPELARRFVQEGAQWLLVITNDAWFGPTAAAYQHAQASTFRAIELRVPIARAANTGWSGCIDPAGRWLGRVRDQDGRELFVAGTHTCEVPLSPAISVYRRWGDWFAWLCLAIALIVIAGRTRAGGLLRGCVGRQV